MTNKVTKQDLILKKWMLKYTSKGPLNKDFTAAKLDNLKLDLDVVSDAYRILKWPVASIEPFWVAHLTSDLWRDVQKGGSHTKKTMAWLRLVKHLVDCEMIDFEFSSKNTFYWSVKLRIWDKKLKKFAENTKNNV